MTFIKSAQNRLITISAIYSKHLIGLMVNILVWISCITEAQHKEQIIQLNMKSAKASTSYYTMMVELSQVIHSKSEGTIQPTVEESQGSIQNVREALTRKGNFFFTSPPTLIEDARKKKGVFQDLKTTHSADTIRSLFTMPSTTVHIVVSERINVHSVTELVGKTIIAGGVGSFCEQQSKTILMALGLENKVNAVHVEISKASAALRNRKVDGFITCASYPSPQISELAATMSVRLLSLNNVERNTILELVPQSVSVTIPKLTYLRQNQPVQTIGTTVGAYVTEDMDEATAYRITRAFWEWQAQNTEKQSWWKSMKPEDIYLTGAQVHRGALKYYKEIGVNVPSTMR